MQRKLIQAILLICGIVIAVGCFELILRLSMPAPENLAKLRSSSIFLFENKPNATFPYRREGEFNNWIELNSDGFRDREFKVEKDPGVLRIAVLGDSQEEALQVELDKTWQKAMARELSRELSKKASGPEGPLARRVESYNFGVSGYGTDQEWLTLREKVWRFSPDLVILAFSPNDVGDTFKNKLVRTRDGRIEAVSIKERVGGNILGRVARQTYSYYTLAKAAGGSQISKSAFENIRVKILGFVPEERFALSDAQLVAGPFEVVASQKNPPSEVVTTWQVVEALIGDMKKQADERGAKFLVTVNIPRVQMRESDWLLLADLYKLDPASSSPYEINDVLTGITLKLGINFYDPRADAVDWGRQEGDLHFREDAHFNVNGHEFMGTKVAEYILANKLIK